MMDNTLSKRMGPVLVHLMRGVLYREDQPAQWQALEECQAAIMDYLGVIGLQLEVDSSEGFALLRQKVDDSPDGQTPDTPLPRLVQRRSLSYPVSLLCVLLRKRLVENDASGDQHRLVISRDQIVEMMQVFLPRQNNEARLVEQIDAHINKTIELGFLREMKGQPDTYEVRRIIKAFVDADWITDFNAKLESYRNHAQRTV